MPNPIIVSIPHSGTRFLKGKLGLEDHVHTVSNWKMIMDVIQDRPIIVPMRKPADVWRSWCRRNEEHTFKNWVGWFFLSYGLLHTLDQMYDIDYICVDKCDDPRIKDWTKVGDQDESHARWKLYDIDLRSLHKLPFVQQHYGSWAK